MGHFGVLVLKRSFSLYPGISSLPVDTGTLLSPPPPFQDYREGV